MIDIEDRPISSLLDPRWQAIYSYTYYSHSPNGSFGLELMRLAQLCVHLVAPRAQLFHTIISGYNLSMNTAENGHFFDLLLGKQHLPKLNSVLYYLAYSRAQFERKKFTVDFQERCRKEFMEKIEFASLAYHICFDVLERSQPNEKIRPSECLCFTNNLVQNADTSTPQGFYVLLKKLSVVFSHTNREQPKDLVLWQSVSKAWKQRLNPSYTPLHDTFTCLIRHINNAYNEYHPGQIIEIMANTHTSLLMFHLNSKSSKQMTITRRSVGRNDRRKAMQSSPTYFPRCIHAVCIDRISQKPTSNLWKSLLTNSVRNKLEVMKHFYVIKSQKGALQKANNLLRNLNPEDKKIVDCALSGLGDPNDIMATSDTDTVIRQNLLTLRPLEWLSDEVIHYFFLILRNRDKYLFDLRYTSKDKRNHFFKSFFFTKLLQHGHQNPECNGIYDYTAVQRWSKNVPGEDIFNLDKIFFPININQQHWTLAVIFMQKRRIQYYDSMGSGGQEYLDYLFQYIQDEHKDKKNAPLPEIDKWELVTTTVETPRQRNGCDCGVFICMFADFLSLEQPLVFSQQHITECRNRIALSILKAEPIGIF